MTDDTMKKRILITGASGCIGHYIVETLIQQTEHELYLLVRNPQKLGFDYNAREGIHLLKADLRDIDKYNDILAPINIAILAATSWGGKQEVFEVNVNSTIRLLKSLNPQCCEQVLYFSTASVLGRDNQLLPQAGEIGTDYIRSKYEALRQIIEFSSVLPPLRILFPTLVLGGDLNKPYSHLSSGLPDVVKWMNLIRWFQAEGSFHFIHAADIAEVVANLVSDLPHSTQPQQLILGNPAITLNQAIQEACAYFNKKVYFRFNLSPQLTNLLIILFRIQMAEWDRFCLEYRHFTYQNPVNPAKFNQPPHYPTLTDVLKLRTI